jgi:serine protease Do
MISGHNRPKTLYKAVTTILPVLLLVAITSTLSRASDESTEARSHAKMLSLAFRQAAEQARSSVVTVISSFDPRNDASLEELREMLGEDRLRRMLPDDGRIPNIGSGVITDNSGLILTNNHVVANADEVVVRLRDGTELVAEQILTDPASDLAIIRVSADENLVAGKLGDSEKLDIGDWVIAIGSPFELEATVSAGIISGKDRDIRRIQRGRLLQTDAAINPGNSGGPLVNLDGEIVGINTAIASNNGGYQGVGFAIPVNRAKWISRELLAHGRVRRAYLGIHIGELNAETARRYGLAARSGALVVDVRPDTPAAEAGLENDDVIVSFAGISVRAPGDLQEAVEQKEIGSSQKMDIVRKGERLRLDVTVGALPEEVTN